MAMIGLGDMAQTFMLRRHTVEFKQNASVAAQELTTGRSANISAKLGGDLSHLMGIETTLTQLKGYRVATDTSALIATSMQSALSNIERLTEDIGTSLLQAGLLERNGALPMIAKDGAQRLDAIISVLNTKVGDRQLFSGVLTDRASIASSDVILAELETAISGAGAITAADIEATVSNWFQSPSGFASIAYGGGPPPSSVAISAEDRITLDITAADPAFRETLKSLAIVALIDRGTAVPNEAVAAGLARTAGTALLQTHSDRATLAGRLGHSQARIDEAQTRNLAEDSALQLARSDLVAIDPFEAATRMEAAQTQLETLYSVTARLSRLSLVDFLR
jgi:flagellar hook-associated protein 3 FlgL